MGDNMDNNYGVDFIDPICTLCTVSGNTQQKQDEATNLLNELSHLYTVKHCALNGSQANLMALYNASRGDLNTVLFVVRFYPSRDIMSEMSISIAVNYSPARFASLKECYQAKTCQIVLFPYFIRLETMKDFGRQKKWKIHAYMTCMFECLQPILRKHK